MPLRATAIRATLTRALQATPAASLLPLLAAGVLLGGCQTAPPAETPGEDILASAPPITRGLDAKGLGTLLTAEMAGQRGRYRDATQGYLDAAERYADPALAERATFAARFSESTSLLQTAAARWQALDPSSTTPGRLLSALAAEQGDWDGALEQRLALAAQGDEARLAALAGQAIAEGAPPAPLLDRLDAALNAADPLPEAGRGDAHLAAALLEKARDNAPAARAHLTSARALIADAPALWRTQAQLALDSGDYRDARKAAQKGLELAPEDARFTLLLVQADIRLGNVAAAEKHTGDLLERHQGGRDLRLALARLYLDEEQPAAARRLLKPLAGRDDLSAAGYFLLGKADEATGDTDSALLYYRQVTGGEELLPASASGARMLIDAGQPADARTFLKNQRRRFSERYSDLLMLEASLLDELGQKAEADALLTQGIERSPDATELLYHRAMRAWQDGDLAGMERDLQQVLKQEPDNVMALNALGYTWADEQVPDRLDDARRLVERAHELAPDNPAVQDSLGWVYFRQGQPDKALPLLERARKRMPDGEVTAHLAEVLHALGKTDRARRLVSEALARRDEHPAIDDLLSRHPELAPASPGE
ncbi:tetratricopeptide repeat protein [Halomonas garicola]|uniref:tetratricopeptide repeat protein n=1 Tax=Halomonas garicola TaxID=1690008 RepID=UPI002897EF69|nr:tetratricopeptide repeat protein [Halomonas garicola]